MSNSNKNDKSGNIGRIREIIRNTEDNLVEAEISEEFIDPFQREIMRERNARRKHSIEELKEELSEEVGKRKSGKS